MPKKSLLLTPTTSGRVDQVLAKMGVLPRSAWHETPRRFTIVRDGQPLSKPSSRLTAGETITLTTWEPSPPRLQPSSSFPTIIYEDPALIVINKPRGQLVYPAHNEGETLAHAVLAYFWAKGIHAFDTTVRPGIVHRLDQGTSGLMLIAKDWPTYIRLQTRFQAHLVQKKYLAVAHGSLGTTETIHFDAPIGRAPNGHGMRVGGRDAKEAHTTVSVWADWGSSSLLCCTITTGRTHQIRVHLAHGGHPLVGDPVYGTPTREGYALHCFYLSFPHPWNPVQLSFTLFPP